MNKLGIASVSLGLFVSLGVAAGAQSNPRVYTPNPQAGEEAYADVPRVDIWLDGYSYRYGEIIRPRIVTEPGAYITIVRVTSDGELRVLYPGRPGFQQRYRDGQFANDRVPETSDGSFYLRESGGTGFIFAIASFNRFDYSYYSSPSGFWSTARLASASRFGNPFEIMRSFAEETVGGDGEYAVDYEMYNVDGRQYRSRYATRYAGYSYNDYLESCLNAFDAYYWNYCSSRNFYGGGPLIIVHQPRAPDQSGRGKQMHLKRLIPDPVMPHVPLQPQPAEGRMPVNNAAEEAAMARREQMLRTARPRVGGDANGSSQQSAPRIYRPAPDPMIARPAPRDDTPRAEPRRADPPPQQPARVEVRNEPPRAAPPPQRTEPSQKPQKDN
jgi:hypothetical protein